MGFRRVKYINFRNIEPQEVQLSGGLNLLTGLNSSGKTNFLEGISLLSGWGPFEGGTKTKDLAARESREKNIILTGQKDDEYGEIIQVCLGERNSIRYNDKPLSSTELRFRMPVLCFMPDDTQLVEGPAARRRRLLDLLLALLIPAYAKRHSEYKRAVRQKAVLLKKGENTEIVEKVMEPLAQWIWKMRKEAVILLSEEMERLSGLAAEGTTLSFAKGGIKSENEEIFFFESLATLREKEQRYRIPLVGPQRDDIIIESNNLPAAEALSRGYRRRTAIALMLAASEGVFRKTGKRPTLLLDEVTAELDAGGREIMFGTLLDRKEQVIAATAEPFTENFRGAVYRVDKGKVEKISE